MKMEQAQSRTADNEQSLSNLQTLSEHLEIQMQLGVMEARDAFEKEKDSLEKYLAHIGDRLDSDNITDENILKIKRSIDELRVQAALAKADTNDAFIAQQEKLDKSLADLQDNIVDGFDNLKVKFEDLPQSIREKLNDFATRFDLFKLQIHLGSADAKDAWEAKKEEIGLHLQDLQGKIAKGIEQGQSDLEAGSNEVARDWDKFRNRLKSDFDQSLNA